MANLPPFAPFPPAKLRLQIPPDEWQSYIEAWIALAEAYLSSPESVFNSIASRPDSSVVSFVKLYVHEYSESSNESLSGSPGAINLRKLVYLLCHRLLSSKSSKTLCHWTFLSEFAHIFSQVSSISKLLDQVWQNNSAEIEGSLQE